MLSFSDIVNIFYPGVSSEEKERLSRVLENESVEYYTNTWALIQVKNLKEEKVQLNLLRSFYQIQFSYYDGVIINILDSFEIWTNQKIVFENFTQEQQQFYEKYYTFIAFQNFSHLQIYRQLTLLGSRFLRIALVWDFPVFSYLQIYFASFCDIEILKADSELFTRSISFNITPINIGNIQGTVADWVKKFNDFDATVAKDKVQAFMNISEVVKLETDAKNFIVVLITIYQGLLLQTIWKDIDFSLCVHSPRGVKDNIAPIDRYLHLLDQSKNIIVWLKDSSSIVEWLKNSPKEYIKNIFQILKKKININNEEEQELLIKFSILLKESNLFNLDVVFFDEQTSQFQWNEEIFT